MDKRRNFLAILCGFFISVSALVDWYLNASLRSRPVSSEELYRYEMFLERPGRVLYPPDIWTYWWKVIICFGALFFFGYAAAKLVLGIHGYRYELFHNNYLQTIALAALIIGLYGTTLFFVNAYLFPMFWKIYMAIGIGAVLFIGTYLVLRSPHNLYLWWKKKGICR